MSNNLAHIQAFTDAWKEIERITSQLAAGGDSPVDLADLFHVADTLRRRVAKEESLAAALDRPAALLLCAMIGLISELYFDTGWCSTGLENKLWPIMQGDARELEPGQEITKAELDHLRALHKKCGGWWYWDQELDGPMFATTAQWLKRLATPSPASPASPEGK